MYASQTKRLCVREAPTEENRAQQHHSASPSDAATQSSLAQQSQSNPTTSSSASQVVSPTSVPVIQTAPTTRSSSRVAQLVGGSSEPSKRAHDKSTSNSNMTASATGSNAGNENESPVKPNLVQPNQGIHPRSASPLVANDSAAKDEPETEDQLIQKLANETREDIQIDLILSIRNLITACNKKKVSLTNNSSFAKVIRMIDSDKHASPKVKTQLALLLCSIAKGGELNVKVLNSSFVDDKLFNLIFNSQDDSLIEACLRCLRAIMSWPRVSRAWLLYDEYSGQSSASTRHQTGNDDKSPNGPKKIIDYALNSNSFVIQECVADILAATCCRDKDQWVLYKSGAIQCLVQLLESPSNRVVKAALNWLAALCLRNSNVSLELVRSSCPSGVPLLDRLIKLMGKNEIQDIQFLAAKCYAWIYRALVPNKSTPRAKATEIDFRITTHVLPTLVRMVHREKPCHLRSESAECIATLIDEDENLQNLASTCDHLIDSLANMLEYDNISLSDIRDYTTQLLNHRYPFDVNSGTPMLTIRPCPGQVLDLRNLENSKQLIDSSGDISRNESAQEMRRTAFLALAALASLSEEVRKRIYDTCSIMQHLIRGLNDSNPATLKSVLSCLLSLSRSVKLQRTSLADNSVYTSLKNLLGTTSNEVLILVLSNLCNISLNFSPGRQHLLDANTIGIICNITKRSYPDLRLEGMSVLMNMVFQLEDQDLKFHILATLGPSYVLDIIETEQNEKLVIKTLGFLRNLLSPQPHIDGIMKNHGKAIMRAILTCLDRAKPIEEKARVTSEISESNVKKVQLDRQEKAKTDVDWAKFTEEEAKWYEEKTKWARTREQWAQVREQALCVLTNIADGPESKYFIMDSRKALDQLSAAICNDEAGNVRLAAICCVTNLAFKDRDGYQLRQKEMRNHGIEDKLKSLLNTPDPDLSNRVRTAYNQFFTGSKG